MRPRRPTRAVRGLAVALVLIASSIRLLATPEPAYLKGLGVEPIAYHLGAGWVLQRPESSMCCVVEITGRMRYRLAVAAVTAVVADSTIAFGAPSAAGAALPHAAPSAPKATAGTPTRAWPVCPGGHG